MKLNVWKVLEKPIGWRVQETYTGTALSAAGNSSLLAMIPLPGNWTAKLMFLRIVQNGLASPARWLPSASLLLFALLAWGYRQQTPLLETPDEPSHFAVVNYIAHSGTLPPRPTDGRSGPVPAVSPDVPFYYAPPLYYWLASLFVPGTDTAEFAWAVIPNPNFARQEGLNLSLSPENKNMYVHTAAQREPNQAAWAAAMWRVRLFSLFFGIIMLAGCFALARQVWPSQWRWRATAVALILFNPTFLYLTNGVTNDTLLVALSTWSFALMASLLRENSQCVGWREGALLLLLTGALLTKQTGFILLPPALVVVMHRGRQQRWTGWRTAGVLAIGAAIVTAVGGWWYLFNGIVYGDPLVLESHNALPPVENVFNRLLFVGEQSWGAFKSYWAAFGWATIFVAPGWYLYFAGLTTVGLTGWLWPRPLLDKSPAPQLTRLLWLAVLLNAALMAVWLWRTAAPYGRLLFPVIAPIACLLVLGCQRWLARLRLGRGLAEVSLQLGLVGPLAVLALLSPVRTVQPALAPVAFAPAEVGDFIPLGTVFGGGYRLLGYTIEPELVQAGDPVKLTLFWQLEQPTTGEGTIETFIQVAPLDPEAQVAATSQLLGTPRYPAAFWQPGEIILQPYWLEIPADAPTPALYWFDLVLFDEINQVRLPVTWEDRPLAENLFRIGPQPVFSSDAVQFEETAVSDQSSLDRFTFGEQIRLNGFTLLPLADGSGLEVTLVWEALSLPTADWTVFVHLVNERGDLVTQGDGPPRGGNFPTTWWTAGTVIPDTHFLPVNIDCGALSRYSLLVGFYNPTTAERLPVSDSRGQAAPNAAVEIQPVCADK